MERPGLQVRSELSAARRRQETAMTRPFSLTPEQREQFLAEGLIRIPGVISSETIEPMLERIWRALAGKYGALRDQPQTWPSGLREPVDALKQMGRAGVFAGVLSPKVRQLLDDFFGNRGWEQAYAALGARPLGPIFPTPHRAWNVPTLHWHLDGVEADAWPDHVRLFAYLARVEAGGGGTFYVAGSHRAVVRIVAEKRARGMRVGSATVVERLKFESPWIADLCSKGPEDDDRVRRFMEEGTELEGVPLRVSEMTAQAGDVILWHPNLLHTYAPCNRSDGPLLVISATLGAVR
jgi:Phytanoyl-CoA dioxygenase (PhyH)